MPRVDIFAAQQCACAELGRGANSRKPSALTSVDQDAKALTGLAMTYQIMSDEIAPWSISSPSRGRRVNDRFNSRGNEVSYIHVKLYESTRNDATRTRSCH